MPADLLDVVDVADAIDASDVGEAQSRALGAVHGVRWLVDNAVAYRVLLEAIDGARESVWMSQLAFDADCVAYSVDDASDTVGRRLVDAVIAASVERAVDVRILLNASLLLDTAAPLRAHLERAGATSVQVRGIGRFPQLLHAKVIVIDHREAFLIGSPFANGYWDAPDHAPVDLRRPPRELGGRPLHDLSCVLAGPTVATLAALFAELWNDVSHAPGAHHALPGRPASDDVAAPIRIVRTAPRRVLTRDPHGVAAILPEIVAGIARARSLIYIEHQYLSARPVVDALRAALDAEPALEAIVVLNQNPDVTAYRGWQNARLAESGLLAHPRVGLFALWSAARATDGAGWDVNQVFVHSKALIVDDAWATVGSANLDGVSLHSYGDDFEGAPGRRIFRHVRNFDVNAVLDDSDGALGGAIAELRATLWREHLGGEVDLAHIPSGGWVAAWRARAARNGAALRGEPSAAYVGRLLPYSTRSTPREQLAEHGIGQSVRLHFNPSWLEVHCSPNWVRNMFA